MTDQLPAKIQVRAGGAVSAIVPQSLDETYRLADAMSRSGMMPRGIQSAEAVMVAIMAGSELGMAPFQAVQAIAIINNRPSLWGDAIPALLWDRGFDIEETFEGEEPGYPDTMKAVCVVTRPNGKKITRSFSVADAKEAKLWTKDGPWQTAKKRMLQMRARGFAARDGAADVLRGFTMAEEVQDYGPLPNDTQPQGTGMRERLESRQIDVDTAGLNVRQITAETEAAAPKRRGRPPKAAQETQETPLEPDDAAPVVTEPANQSEALAEFTENPTETASAPIVEAELDLSDSVMTVSDDTQAEVSGITDESRQDFQEVQSFHEADVISPGYPEQDEVYFLEGDSFDEEGRRDTYKNGLPFSTSDGRAGHGIYADHRPEHQDGPAPKSDFPPEFDAYIDAINNAKVWNDALNAMKVFYQTKTFTDMSPVQQNKVRANTWETLSEERNLSDLPDPAQNISAYRLWIESAEDADAIQFTLAVLEKEPAFSSKPDNVKQAIRDAAAARVALLKA